MSIRSKGLVFAMEEAEITDVEGSESEIAEGMSEIDSAAVDRQQEETDIDDLEMAIEEAMDDADTLEDIGEVMEDSVESGEGLSPEAAEMAEIAVESICNRLGIRNANVLPAMESFGSSSSRVAATRIAMENVGARVKQIWESIKTAVINLFKQIGEFVYKYLGDVPRLQKLIKDVDKQVKEFKGGELKSQVFENQGIANAFSVKERLDVKEVDELFNTIKATIKGSVEYQKAIEERLTGLEALYADVKSVSWMDFEKKAQAKADFGKKVLNAYGKQGFVDAASGLLGKIPSALGFESDSGKLTVKTARLLNKKILVVAADEDTNNTSPYVKVQVTDNPEAVATAAAVPTLTKEQMASIVKAASEVASELAGFRGKSDPKKMSDKFVKLIDKAIKAAEEAEGGDSEDTKQKKEYLMKQRREVTMLSQSSGVAYRRTVSDGIGVCRSALKYVTESMKQYNAKAEK